MAAIVDLKTEVVHRYVFELRYEFGQIYWDRAGRIAKEILRDHGGWDFNAIDVNHCQLGLRDQNLVFNFGHGKLDLSQAQSLEVQTLLPFGEFGKLAESFATTVGKHLELDTFPRIGFRVWHLYPSADRDQSYHFLRRLKLFSLNAATSEPLGEISELSHRLVVNRGSHMLRVAIAPFEQQVDLPPSVIRAAKTKASKTKKGQKAILIDQIKAKKTISHFPQFGLLLDLDAYIEDPPFPDDLSISDFIAAAFHDFGRVKEVALEARHRHKGPFMIQESQSSEFRDNGTLRVICRIADTSDDSTMGETTIVRESTVPRVVSESSVSGEARTPGLSTAGMRSTGSEYYAPIRAGRAPSPSSRVLPKVTHACAICFAACVDDLDRALNHASDFFQRNNALEQLKDSLAQLWKMRREREEQFAEVVNMLQATFARRRVEDFTTDQLACLRSVLDRLRQEPAFNDEFANAITLELMAGGIDVFRELE